MKLKVVLHALCKNLKLSENARSVDVGWVRMRKHNFVVNGPKFTRFVLSNAGQTVVDNALDCLSIY